MIKSFKYEKNMAENAEIISSPNGKKTITAQKVQLIEIEPGFEFLKERKNIKKDLQEEIILDWQN